jgi:hypothetical protein
MPSPDSEIDGERCADATGYLFWREGHKSRPTKSVGSKRSSAPPDFTTSIWPPAGRPAILHSVSDESTGVPVWGGQTPMVYNLHAYLSASRKCPVEPYHGWFSGSTDVWDQFACYQCRRPSPRTLRPAIKRPPRPRLRCWCASIFMIRRLARMTWRSGRPG